MNNILIITLLLNFISGGDSNNDKIEKMSLQENYEIATIGGGCFWCSEAVFEVLKGVISVESGYSGGFVKNPSYREVCNGTTGHAEVIQIRFETSIIDFRQILEVFFQTHNPTTLNQQGADVGTQYRSVIFYHNQSQKKIAESLIKELSSAGNYENPIVTEIASFSAFYKAEEYHQDYFAKNPHASYCTYVINPKMDKFRKKYHEKLK